MLPVVIAENKKKKAKYPCSQSIMYLYPMLLEKTDIYFNAQAKPWWLALTFLIGFFAISGYVSNVQQNGAFAFTEHTGFPTETLKKAISYKQARALFYYKHDVNPFFKTDDYTAVILYNKAVHTQYLCLKRLDLLIPRLIFVLNTILPWSSRLHGAFNPLCHFLALHRIYSTLWLKTG